MSFQLKHYNEAIIWDNHACMPLRANDTSFLPQLERHRAVGVSLLSLNVSFDLHDWSQSFKVLANYRTFIRRHADKYKLIDTVSDIREAKREGKLGICFDIEGGCAVDDLPELIEPYYKLGVRWLLTAYNQNNRLGGGCQDEDFGLTEFGERVIDEMERVGMIVDVSHTGYRTAREVMDYCNKPVNFSHSNPKSIWDHDRNVPDDLIRACAKSGGVFNLNGIGFFLGKNDNTTETFVRHVDYAATIAGPKHVGMGLDYVFDTSELDEYLLSRPDLFPPEKGYSSGINMIEPERIPEIASLLSQIGWSVDNILDFLGRNNMRVAEQVWK